MLSIAFPSIVNVFHRFRIVAAMIVVGDDRADEAADQQCADYRAGVIFAIGIVMMYGRRRMMMDHRRLLPGGASVDGRPAMDGAAFVRHGSYMVRRVFMDSAAMVDRAALVGHGFYMMRRAFVNGGTAMEGAAFVRHRLRLVLRRLFADGCAVMLWVAFLHRAGLVFLRALVHGPRLMDGRTFLRRTDLLVLGRSPAAAVVAGGCRLGNAHQKRGAQETCHQRYGQYFL